MKTNNSSQEALADAMTGVAGSLVAMLTFYPIDVMKTNLQAASSSSTHSTSTTATSSSTYVEETQLQRKWMRQLSSMLFVKSIFRGLHYKIAHTTTSSFTYFFIYSFIKARHKRAFLSKQRRKSRNSKSESMRPYKPSTSSRLLLSALAGMVNVTITFPLDVLAARSQTSTKKDSDSTTTRTVTKKSHELEKKKHHGDAEIISSDQIIMDKIWNELKKEDEDCKSHICTNQGEEKSSNVTSTIEYIGSESTFDSSSNGKSDIGSSKKASLIISPLSSSSYLNNNIFQLWSGITPALLLCSNPAINFTVFDILKDYILLSSKSKSSNTNAKLSLMEAFIIGLIAKFAATIATYPLIRAKVMLMVANKVKEVNEEEKLEDETDAKNTPNSEGTKNLSLTAILCKIHREEGLNGLYKGCRIQLFHTMLKSALLMMVRENIASTARNLIVGE